MLPDDRDLRRQLGETDHLRRDAARHEPACG
jgi:hypothetical protein